jgi:TonB family protein
LEKAVGTRAFGPFPSIDVVPSEMAARLQPAGEAVLAELKSGRFDAGLAPRSFKDDVARLHSASDVPEFSVKLADADHFRFDSYVDPQYPPLAKQARISGTVELEVTSNPTTGETEQVTVISCNPLLAQVAKESAQHWRFVPGTDTALHATRVVLDFVFQCL